MRLLFALLLFPAIVFGQSVKTDYNDSLSRSNLKRAIIDYLSVKINNWNDYEEVQWGIASIYTRYDDRPEGELFIKNAVPVVNRYKLYDDSVKFIKKTVADTMALGLFHFQRLSDSLEKYKSLALKIHQQYKENEKRYRSLKYYIVDFFFKKKGSTNLDDADAYSFHVAPDFRVVHALHISKEALK